MKIRYKGGRSRIDVTFNRKAYNFTPENNKTLDIREQAVVNYIFSLSNRSEFEAMVEEKPCVEEKKEEVFKCEICEFIAKSAQGLLVHNSKHKKGGK